MNTNWTGSAAYVLAGAGQGQMRTVRLGGIEQNRTWMLEKPFGGAGGGVPLGAGEPSLSVSVSVSLPVSLALSLTAVPFRRVWAARTFWRRRVA